MYASMLLIVATIVTSSLSEASSKVEGVRPAGPSTSSGKKRAFVVLLFFIALTLVTTLSRVATAQWWIEVVLLAFFVRTLHDRQVRANQVAAWFALSIIPHAALAIWQYFTGSVFGSTWLGMAAHLSEELGVAVVEHDDVRILRAYGGFPHPNILGGWMAIGLVAVLQLASWAKTKWHALAWSLCAGLCSIALVISYSRSAWVAAVVGLIAVGAHAVRPVRHADGRHAEGRVAHAPTGQFLALVIFVIVAFGGAVAFSQRAHVLARTDATQRIEVKSVKTRMQSLTEGWNLFLAHPIVGTGPNAYLAALAPSCGEKCREPLEPPHNVFLLMLVEVGLVGIFLCAWYFRLSRRFWTAAGAPIVAALFILLTFDHYVWSTWSGLCLGALALLMAIRDDRLPTLDTNANSA